MNVFLVGMCAALIAHVFSAGAPAEGSSDEQLPQDGADRDRRRGRGQPRPAAQSDRRVRKVDPQPAGEAPPPAGESAPDQDDQGEQDDDASQLEPIAGDTGGKNEDAK